MINLFNFGIKTVVHIVIKHDNSQIKMKIIIIIIKIGQIT